MSPLRKFPTSAFLLLGAVPLFLQNQVIATGITDRNQTGAREIEIEITVNDPTAIKDIHIPLGDLAGDPPSMPTVSDDKNLGWTTSRSGGNINYYSNGQGPLPGGTGNSTTTAITVQVPPGFEFTGNNITVILTGDGDADATTGVATTAAGTATIVSKPIKPKEKKQGGVTTVSWPIPSPKPKDKDPYGTITLAPGQSIEFYWTRNGRKHPSYKEYKKKNTSKKSSKSIQIVPPNDPSVTDYFYSRSPGEPGDPNAPVTLMNVSDFDDEGGSWLMQSLTDVPNQNWSIPELGAADSDAVIHTAVNLRDYLASNPHGFTDSNGDPNWAPGDFLAAPIITGQMPGLDGVFWASGPFVFDPNSSTGWVPQAGPSAWLDSDEFELQHGPIEIIDVMRRSIPADINGDDAVDNFDLAELAADWLATGITSLDTGESCPCDGDQNSDNTINASDLSVVLSCQGASASTPGCENADINCDDVIDATDSDILNCMFGGPGNPACCDNP